MNNHQSNSNFSYEDCVSVPRWLLAGVCGALSNKGSKHAKMLEELRKYAVMEAKTPVTSEAIAYVLTRNDEIYWESDDGIVISNTPGDCLDERYEWRPVGFMSQPAVRGAEHE